jgi:Fur family transcriptional regulator, ferric uptake regulator
MIGRPIEILNKFELRHTHTREQIVAAFLRNQVALSHGDIENAMLDDYDRVTIYRTLKTFVEKGILHRIPDDGGGVKYALCSDACGGEYHRHDHVHFKCETCGDTTCIDGLEVPIVALPLGYKKTEVNYLVQGVCPKCN